MSDRSSLLGIALAVAVGLGGCSAPEKGACIRGSGPTATCGNDFTDAQCILVNGDEFHEGKTCRELGFGKPTRSHWAGPAPVHRAP